MLFGKRKNPSNENDALKFLQNSPETDIQIQQIYQEKYKDRVRAITEKLVELARRTDLPYQYSLQDLPGIYRYLMLCRCIDNQIIIGYFLPEDPDYDNNYCLIGGSDTEFLFNDTITWKSHAEQFLVWCDSFPKYEKKFQKFLRKYLQNINKQIAKAQRKAG